MRNSLRVLVSASALCLTAGILSAQTTRARPSQEDIDARRKAAQEAMQTKRAQVQARVEQTKEQMEARREAAKAAAEAKREAARSGSARPTRPTPPTTRPAGAGANDARRAAMKEYQELRHSLLDQVKAGTLNRAAAEAQIKAWRDAHRPGAVGGGN